MSETVAPGLLARLRATLPEGRGLPADLWEARHRGVLYVVAGHALLLPFFGLAMGWSTGYSVGEPLLIAALGAVAWWPRLGRRFRASTAALACVTSSAVLVQFSGGVIEAHFHFFVVVALISLYQDWIPFLLAILYVALDHGVVGTLLPSWVFNHPQALANPWLWAGIHAVLVLAECVVLVVVWKANETTRAAMDAAISERERERALALTRESEIRNLREIDAFKTNFINTTAHELSTPLTPLRIQVHVLKARLARERPNPHERSVDIVERGIERLSAMVADLLEATRVQANRLGLRREPCDIDDVVHVAVEAMRETCARKEIQLEHRRAKLPVVEADPHRIGQVVLNLLVNAVKFTPAHGRIVVGTEVRDGAVRVSVSDTGIGIAPQQIARLFQPFQQVHDTMQFKEAGSGLGLYISKGIVELHGGKIWCSSDGPGKGTTFAFAIPTAPVNAVPSADSVPAASN